jgi:hypothetical protein
MAKENPIPNSKPFKKGQSGNRAGRPKRLVSGVTDELIKEGYTPVTASEVQQVYKTLLQLTEPRLKAIVADGEQPMLLRIVAKAMLSQKGFEVIEKMMDRGHGRPANVLSLQKTDTDPLTDAQQDSGTQLSGINIVIVGGSRPAIHTEQELEQQYGSGG